MDRFLDTGVVIGYCFYLDTHAVKCRRYVSDSIIEGSDQGFKSTSVDNEFSGRCKSKVPEIRNEILKHRRNLLGSSLDGNLDALDFATITDKHVDPGWEIAPALHEWYDKEVHSGIEFEDLVQRVSNFARTIEQRLTQRLSDLESAVRTISRKDLYTTTEASITKIPSDDRKICLDAHHVGQLNGNKVELATTNPKHLKDNGREHLLTTETSIHQVKDLSY